VAHRNVPQSVRKRKPRGDFPSDSHTHPTQPPTHLLRRSKSPARRRCHRSVALTYAARACSQKPDLLHQASSIRCSSTDAAICTPP